MPAQVLHHECALVDAEDFGLSKMLGQSPALRPGAQGMHRGALLGSAGPIH